MDILIGSDLITCCIVWLWLEVNNGLKIHKNLKFMYVWRFSIAMQILLFNIVMSEYVWHVTTSGRAIMIKAGSGT